MKSALSFTVLAGSSTAALGVTTQCSAGFVHKDDITGLMCMSNVNNAASCNSECCKNDENTCGGIDAKKPIHCAYNQFKAGDDAWQKTPATSATAEKVCCAAKATCASATCPAGYKLNTQVEQRLCAGDAKSCGDSFGDLAASGACCIKDVTLCGGNTITCANAAEGKYVTGGALEDDNWKKSVGANAAKCCKKLPVCNAASVTCPYGQTKTSAATVCTDKKGVSSADAKDCSRKVTGKDQPNPCCTAKANTCYKIATGKGNPADPCPALGKYIAEASYASTYITKKETTCCTAQATCADATCPSGYKKNKNSAAAKCGGDAKSCVKAAMLNTCCTLNVQTCGGLSGINCKYGYFNEKTMWNGDTAQSVKDAWNNKPANATNKNTNCCTARATCDRTATTTPAPFTSTPAAAPVAALKYSQNKAVVTQKAGEASTSNLVWLACGAFVGMSIMSVVQHMRRASAREPAYSEDTEMLMQQ